jgi:hypothetical protein
MFGFRAPSIILEIWGHRASKTIQRLSPRVMLVPLHRNSFKSIDSKQRMHMKDHSRGEIWHLFFHNSGVRKRKVINEFMNIYIVGKIDHSQFLMLFCVAWFLHV